MSPDLHHLSGAYAVDALDDTERTSFEQHLAVCADCRAEVAELSSAAHSLGSLTEATPSPALRASVLAGITRVRPLPPLTSEAEAPSTPDATAPQQPPTAPSKGEVAASADASPDDRAHPVTAEKEHLAPVVPLFRRTSTWFAAAAAAVLLSVGGIAWSPWSNDTGTSISAIEQVQSAPDATTLSFNDGAVTAKVDYSRQLGQSAISVTGLPPAPEGKTYQLWYFTKGGSVTSAGLMDPADDGTGAQLLDGDANTASKVGMTLEPAGGSDQPTTKPLVVIDLV
ncbi:MAG: anti-sigma factor [Ornithinibacter sp.]